MSLKKSLIAGLAIAAFAAPALADNPELSATPKPATADVTTEVEAGCAITGSLTVFQVEVSMNGEIELPDAQELTVTCNHPTGSVEIGSVDMTNEEADIDTTEEESFTNVIKFSAKAASDNGWRIDSRSVDDGGDDSLNDATVGWDGAGGANRRIRALDVSIINVDLDGKMPVAGDYTGTMCVTVTVDNFASSGSSDGDVSATCAAVVVPD